MNKKLYFFIGMGCAAGSLFFGASSVRAQAVPVGFTPPEGTGTISSAGGANYCFAINPGGSTNSLPAASAPSAVANDSNPVGVLVDPDGNNYGIRGSYTAIPPDCSSLSGDTQALCQSVSSAFSQAVGAANSQNGFPQGGVASPRSSYAGNTVSLQFGAGVCGTRGGEAVPLCESTVTLPNSSGGNDVISYIYFDTDSLNNPSGQSPGLSATDEFTAAAFEGNAPFAQCDFAHELTHSFGLADVYNSGQYPGLMGNECADIFDGDASNTYPNFWSPNEAATVAWLNSGKPLAVDSDSCNYNCPAGSVITFSQATKGGPFTASCDTIGDATTKQISCSCNTDSPYCTNLATQQAVEPPTQEFALHKI